MDVIKSLNNEVSGSAKLDATEQMAQKTLTIAGRPCVVHGYAGDPFFAQLCDDRFDDTVPGGYGSFASFCAKYLRPDYIMLDVGANVGITALVAAAHLPNGKIVAIDASPRNCHALKQNLLCNHVDDAVVVPFAVGSAPGELQFNESGAVGHVLTPSVALGRTGITVPVKTIDQIVHELDLPKVDFIKVDVEGFERDAIIGAKETIKKWNPLFFIEFNSWCQIAVHNESPMEFYNFLMEKFSHVYRIEGDGLVALEKGAGLHFLYHNILRRGCIEDVVATTSADRLIEAPNYLVRIIERLKVEKEMLRSERDALREERDHLLAERGRLTTKLDRMKHSAYWRFGRPFRKIAKKLK